MTVLPDMLYLLPGRVNSENFKIQGGINFYFGPPFVIFFQGGYTHPLPSTA